MRDIKKNESEKEIGSNGEMETREERERESCVANRERYVLGGERKVNKIIKRIIAFLSVRSQAYCSMSHNFETFSTPHEGLFFVFGVPNAT